MVIDFFIEIYNMIAYLIYMLGGFGGFVSWVVVVAALFVSWRSLELSVFEIKQGIVRQERANYRKAVEDCFVIAFGLYQYNADLVRRVHIWRQRGHNEETIKERVNTLEKNIDAQVKNVEKFVKYFKGGSAANQGKQFTTLEACESAMVELIRKNDDRQRISDEEYMECYIEHSVEFCVNYFKFTIAFPIKPPK